MKPSRAIGQDFTRRDFLKGSSTAAAMAMMGGIRLIAQTQAESGGKKKEFAGPPAPVALIGLGTWGRTILNALTALPEAKLVGICDSYQPFLNRCASAAPGARTTTDYKTLLADPLVAAVIVATPTHQHKDIVLAAIAAGKHVYCEAPIANNIEDARAIASAAKSAPYLIFQPGLQLRCDPQRLELIRTFRSGAIGDPVMVRTQWHKKMSWRAASPKPEREKEMNWRLDPALSLGMAGELLTHQLDQATWFLNQLPVAFTGAGHVGFWKDGREVPDTIRLITDFRDGLSMSSDATLANSFDGDYEMYYGSESALMLRQSDVWLFKEVDARLLGWEVYFPKQTILNETGIILKVGASKSVAADNKDKDSKEAEPPQTPLTAALTTFLRNTSDFITAREDFIKEIGSDDPEDVRKHLATEVNKRPAPGYQEAFRSTVSAIKAHEAVRTQKRIDLNPRLYQI